MISLVGQGMSTCSVSDKPHLEHHISIKCYPLTVNNSVKIAANPVAF